MWKNYFKLSARNLWNYKTYSLINLSGFSIGMMSVILLYFYIQGELSYDTFHENKEKIYRLVRTSVVNGETSKIAMSSPPFAPTLQLDFEGIMESTLRVSKSDRTVRYKDLSFVETRHHLVDPNFFEFFSYPLIRGDAKKVLSEVNSLVISDKIAEKYFGKEDPMGKILEFGEDDQKVVTGVFKKTDQKSHLDIDLVSSTLRYQNSDWFSNWWANGFCTYIQLKDPKHLDELKAQLPAFMDKHLGEDFKRRGDKNGVILQPLEDIYFADDTNYDGFVSHGSRQTVRILSAVAMAIFFIVCFNYVNLATAISFKRAKEVGIRKVLGGNKQQLIIQFLIEALTITLLASFIAICLSEILLPYFNSFFGIDVSIELYSIQNITLFVIMISGLGTLAGIYPAFLMSNFRPIKALKGTKQKIGQGIFLRRGLVITQFSISVFMIISTLIIVSQLYYLQDKDLGFDQEAVALVELNGPMYENVESFRDALRQHPGITNASFMSGQPGGFHDSWTLKLEGQEQNPPLRTHSVFVDFDYFKTMELKLITGRNFSEEYSTDVIQAVMLNKTAVKLFGSTPEDIVGKKIKIPSFDSLNHEVIGVVEDYHFATLKDKIAPLFMMVYGDFRTLAIKFDPNTLGQGLASLREEWDKFYPNATLNYEFLDETFYRHYESEQKQSKVFIVFAIISILLSCLGIFGLSSYTTEQRKKEMGIRRVLGASAWQLLKLLSTEFILLILIAAFIASPLVYWFMGSWLANFAYHTFINPLFFLLALGGTLLIAFSSIIFQTWRSAHVNPVEILKDE